jgi:ankyrin repeat protein
MAHEADIDTPNIARLLFQNRPLFRSLLSKMSVSSLSTWDRTIIHDAIQYGMPLRETLEMLRQADKLPSLAQTNNDGWTAIEYAATCQALESVTILLSYGSPPGKTSYILTQKLQTVGDKAWCKQAKKIVSSVFTQRL